MPRPITYKTDDGVTIHGIFCPGNAEKDDGSLRRGLVLLHMMPATKESWTAFKPQLLSYGFSILAIDLRGHGQSKVGPNGTRLLYQLFNEREHQAKIKDVEAGVGWLMGETEIELRNIGLVGASIGANLAIAYAGSHPEVPAAAALSPGWDYHGVTTPDKVEAMTDEQALFLAASDEDDLSFRTDRDLAEIKPDAVVKEYHEAGHGTNIFIAQPELMVELARWLSEKVPAKDQET